jgi:hypothetical protein
LTIANSFDANVLGRSTGGSAPQFRILKRADFPSPIKSVHLPMFISLFREVR